MIDTSSQEASLAKQQRLVDSLRRQLYAQPDPTQSPDLSEALEAAEAELERLGQEPAPAAEGQVPGLLLDMKGQGEKPGGILMGPETTGIDASVLLRMPYVPTGIVHLLDPRTNPLVTFRIENTGRDTVRLRLTSFVEQYSARAIDTLELRPKHTSTIPQPVEIDQLPTFFLDRLRPITEMTHAALQIRIDDLDGGTEQESTFPIWLLARNAAFNGMRDPTTGQWIDLTSYYGAWITPNDPLVMRLLRTAADLHPQRRMVGYQVGPEEIYEQVKAVYCALQDLEIVYVYSVLSFGGSQGQALQRVRLPRESIQSRSANCIDGTLLMASVLEAASLNPAIVVVPAHAFLAWETGRGSDRWDYLETTMIGTHDFEAACASGREQAERAQARRDKSGNPRDFRRLSVAELRSVHGVTPME